MTNNSIKHISKKIRDARVELRLTQKELADKSGLSMNYISRIERADVSPTLETLEKLIKALKIKSSDILSF